MNFEVGEVSKIEVGAGGFLFLEFLWFLQWSSHLIYWSLVPDFCLSPVKLPVFRLFDKMLSLNTQAALREETCDLWSKHEAVRQVLDSNG